MNSLIAFSDSIRIDSSGRYSLNDIHSLSGGRDKDKPGHWLNIKSTLKLIESISNSGKHSCEVYTSHCGRYGGTYAVEELCIDYAEWILGAEFTAMILARISDASILIRAIKDMDIPEDLPDMFVYIAREVDTGNVKIGISKDPAERVKKLQIGNSSKIELIATKPASNRFTDERMAHMENAEYRIHGEWFTGKASITNANGF